MARREGFAGPPGRLVASLTSCNIAADRSYCHALPSVSSLDEHALIEAIAAADLEDSLPSSLGDAGEVENPGDEIKVRYSAARGPQPLT